TRAHRWLRAAEPGSAPSRQSGRARATRGSLQVGSARTNQPASAGRSPRPPAFLSAPDGRVSDLSWSHESSHGPAPFFLLTPDSLDPQEEGPAPPWVGRVERPRAREFAARSAGRAQPVILAGAARHWPARTRWEPQELARRFSDRAVPVVRSGQGGSLFDPWNGVNYAPMTVRAYVEAVAEQRSDLYMIFRVQDHLSELLDDSEVPDVWARAGWFGARFWFAIDGTAGPLHADLPHNLYAQVVGRKQFLLAHYRHTARVYPFPPWSGVPNYCRVDPERPDL